VYCSYRRRRRKVKWKRIFKIFLVIALIAACFAYYKTRIATTIIDYTFAEIESKVTASVNKAVLLNLDAVSYDDLVTVEKNAAGDITLMSADSMKINRINREIAVSAQALITAACDAGVDVPIGALSGIVYVSGLGPTVTMDILSAENVICSFYSEFEGMGINQTRHAVYIRVDSSVNVIIPGKSKTVSVKTDVLICEAVIVGKIPEIYLNGSIF
jgi:sporulation protein yunB